MLRSLFSGISGLRAHQTMMDVVANNIANVNTVGYKSSQAVFKDTLSQMIKGAGAPQGALGGTNPAQIGLGVQLAAVTTNFTQGASQMSGRSSDLMIQGDGFFVVKSAGEQLYTRAGALSLDANGRLTAPDGGVLQGWTATAGVINTNATVGDVQLPIGTILPGVLTSSSALGGNLNAAETKPVTTKITTYDAKGAPHSTAFTFTKTADGTAPAPPATGTPDTWDVTGTTDGASIGPAVQMTFDHVTGARTSATTATFGALTIDLTAITQFAGANTATVLSQNGSEMGTLQSYSIAPDGTVNGTFSNGLKQPLAQLALGTFNNPGGLEKVGNTMFRATVNTGTERIGTAGTGGRGLLAGGMTEMSNVDLAAEFTNLIISQRGFQANSRVITASDELLTDLVNMKR